MSGFLERYQGSFRGVLRWHQLDDLWRTVRGRAGEGWYIYTVGDEPPSEPAGAGELDDFIDRTDRLLRRLHEEDYCGIVYADDFEHPALIKIFHPKNLGASCGSSGRTILPGWTLSTLPPADLLDWVAEKEHQPGWWRKLAGGLRWAE